MSVAQLGVTFVSVMCACALSLQAQTQSFSSTPATPLNSSATEILSYSDQVVPLLKEFCFSCHGQGKAKGEVALDRYPDEHALLQDRGTWEKVRQQVRAHTMPPESRPQPSAAQRALLLQFLEHIRRQVDCAHPDPGRVTLRRLNRAEYRNTIRDLLGVDYHATDHFPADDVGYGFDHIGDVLSLSPLLLEKYLAAADTIVESAFKPGGALGRRFNLPQFESENEYDQTRDFLDTFARRAFRRPLAPGEVGRFLELMEQVKTLGLSPREALQEALKMILVSPHFLFRGELPSTSDPAQAVHPIPEYALASRLSYFLWSSMPDDELFTLAEAGRLRANLDGQVKRMLRDAKAEALTENFAGQWLQWRNLQSINPDRRAFPKFNSALRAAMLRESELCFEYIVQEDRSLLELIAADYTFLNERLAKHYQIEGVTGENFRRVALTDTRRGGLLTQAGILTLTSNPTRTSPVKRGKWILDNLLGMPPPPPPPDVPELKETQAAQLSGSLRQRMEQHRSDALCASCHALMDPLGFALENFDATGAWREQDGQFPIDAEGVLPSGERFNGVTELRAILLRQKDQFARCLSEKMLTYALGRGLEDYDQCAINEISARLMVDEFKFSSFILAVVQSTPFQMQRGTERHSRNRDGEMARRRDGEKSSRPANNLEDSSPVESGNVESITQAQK